MASLFMDGGIYMWPLLIIAIVITVLAITKGIQLSNDSSNINKLENGINAILFWGAFALVLGFFAHFHGVYLAMQAINAANDISPAIVAGGYAMSLITILTGLFIFMLSALVWFIYRWKLKQTNS